MIHLITHRPDAYKDIIDDKLITLSDCVEFKLWYKKQTASNFDTETTVTEGLYSYKKSGPKSNRVFVLDEAGNKIPEQRKLLVAQIGSIDQETQFIFDNPLDDPKMTKVLKEYLEHEQEKYIHNALFDCSVSLFNLGVNPKNVRDTMLLSHILHTGLDMPKGWHSYAGCLERYLQREISKEEQTTFSEEPLTLSQIKYAAIDVLFPEQLYKAMYKDIEKWGLQNVATLENAVVRAYAHSMVDNFYLDIDKWKVNMAEQQLELDTVREELYAYIKENFYEQCVTLGFILATETYDFNWRSSTKVKAIFSKLYPDMTASTKPERVKYLASLEENPHNRYLHLLNSGNTDVLEGLLISQHKELLIETGICKLPGVLEFNLNSNDQTLAIFRLIKPDLVAVNKKALSKIRHPLKTLFDRYNKAAKLVQSYGQNFIDQVNPDGMLRPPDYQQILQTGRTSMKLYQLLPGKNTYRNCFHYEPGWSVVSCDFASQEAVIAATVCKDEKMLKIFENNWDFHSYCASLLFPDEWKRLGGDPEPKDKPEDKLLVSRRNATKATSFGDEILLK